MSEVDKKKILSEIDKKIDDLPKESLVWLDGYLTGAIKATVEQREAETKEGA